MPRPFNFFIYFPLEKPILSIFLYYKIPFKFVFNSLLSCFTHEQEERRKQRKNRKNKFVEYFNSSKKLLLTKA